MGAVFGGSFFWRSANALKQAGALEKGVLTMRVPCIM